MKERRQANIDDTEKLLDGFPFPEQLSEHIPDEETLGKMVYTAIMQEITQCCNFIVDVLFHNMEDILKNRFTTAWYEINFHECMSGLYELSQIIAHSLDNTQQKTWRAAIKVQLEEKLLASKRTMLDLDRVHSAFCNAVPLVNYTAKPDGRFDSFYPTKHLFKQSSEINETYSRLRGHLMGNMQNIETLLNLTSMEVPNGETGYLMEYINCTTAFKAVSAAYIADLQLYESLVIKLPQERLFSATRFFLNTKDAFPSSVLVSDISVAFSLLSKYPKCTQWSFN